MHRFITIDDRLDRLNDVTGIVFAINGVDDKVNDGNSACWREMLMNGYDNNGKW